MKVLQISDPASEELREAVRWYEERRPGWGGKLFGEARTGRRPNRQLRVLGFPYKVAYRIRELDIYLVAVAHTSRRPAYWKDRR